MIKFEFTLDDTDAANLIAILHEEKCRSLERAAEHQLLVDQRDGNHPTAQANANWYRAHATYLDELRMKVLAGNTRVD